MKRFYPLLCGLLMLMLFKNAAAQIGVQFEYVKPSGDFGYLFKPAMGAGLSLTSGEVDDRFRMRTSIGYFTLTPRQDTFFSYGMQYGGSGTMYLPAYDVWHYYRVIPVSAGGTFKILDEDFSPTAGLDFDLYFVSYQLDSYLSTVHEKSYTGGSVLGGVYPHVGASYEIDGVAVVFADLGKGLNVDLESFKGASLWKFRVGGSYYFN